MRPPHVVKIAGVLMIVGVLELGMIPARAQAPAPAPAPPPAVAPAPSLPTVARPAVPASRPALARNAVPNTARVGGQYRDWSAGRTIKLAKPWLRPMR
jgi:hypothetical protein